MKNIEYTCETRIIPDREGEPVKAIRLNNTETLVHHVTHGKEYGPISYTEHFMTGPIADKLYDYEALGYSPTELKKIIRELMVRRDVANTVYGKNEADRMRVIMDHDRYTYSFEPWRRMLFDAPVIPKEAAVQIKPMNLVVPDGLIDKYKKNLRFGGFGEYICSDVSTTKAVANERYGYFAIKKVIFNDPATIVFWADGTKTVVKATNEKFDPEKGLAMAISKRALGDKGNYFEVFKKHLKESK